MRSYLPAIVRVTLAVSLILSTLAMLYTTGQNSRSIESLAIRALESTALALSTSAENVLRAGGSRVGEEMRDILSDRVVAYALIASKNGVIQFHTNPRLVGTIIEKDDLPLFWPSSTASGHRITLGTGLPAYEFNYILHRPGGNDELLRLVLHTTPADQIVADAGKMWWPVGIALSLLWGIGIIGDRMFRRQLRLRDEVEGKRRFALIGQMTAVMAHEIRNALGSIKGYAQWVDEKIPEPDPKKAGLSAVLKGAERIERLVQELLLYSREETYHLEPVNLGVLIPEAIHASTSSWTGKVQVLTELEVPVIADREKLHRVLVNGIRNAIEAMGEAGILQISAHPDRRWVEIWFEDNGPGISSDERSCLFTPFHTTKTDGTGLGLAYSKRVVEGMGGKIDLANRKNGTGAILTICLPKGREGRNE